jgi:hypothetical protein
MQEVHWRRRERAGAQAAADLADLYLKQVQAQIRA